jgi:hypothetical protein
MAVSPSAEAASTQSAPVGGLTSWGHTNQGRRAHLARLPAFVRVELESPGELPRVHPRPQDAGKDPTPQALQKRADQPRGYAPPHGNHDGSGTAPPHDAVPPSVPDPYHPIGGVILAAPPKGRL